MRNRHRQARAAGVLHDEGSADVLDGPGRREAAIGWLGLTMSQKRPPASRNAVAVVGYSAAIVPTVSLLCPPRSAIPNFLSLAPVGTNVGTMGECAMSKRPSKSKSRSKALPALGFAGVSLSMAGGACASTSEASANTPPPSQSNELFLGEEELSDVSLATFYVFDKENAGTPPLAQQLRLAARGGCGGGCGCHGCGGGGCHMGCGGGCRCGGGIHMGCGGCHVACRGCRCGGFFFRGCGGCGGCGGCWGTCLVWTPLWPWSCWGESTPATEVSSGASEQSAPRAEVAVKGDGTNGIRTK
jgi:hypothetical protein